MLKHPDSKLKKEEESKIKASILKLDDKNKSLTKKD
jgi:hypothetical protein